VTGATTSSRPRSASKEAILAATRQAIAERGSGRLTLSAVAAAAGVSRPTLYRWFPTKEHLLASITEYEKEQFALALGVAVASASSASGRLDAALHQLVTYLDASMSADPIGVDPGYALQSLAASLDPQSELLVEHLGEALAKVPAVEAGALMPHQAAEMFLRLAYSHYLMPHPQPEVVLTALRAFAGLLEPSLESR
jgi:AcrR family transcriptional regulator